MGKVKGRFFTNAYELRRMNRDIRQQQENYGPIINWWILVAETSDDTYDEPVASGGGRTWNGPTRLPTLSVVPLQGMDVASDSGRYILDTVKVRMELSEVTESGLDPDLANNFAAHYGDRFQYRNHIFDVHSIRTEGHFDPASDDIIIEVTGTQLRADELIEDTAFAAWSA